MYKLNKIFYFKTPKLEVIKLCKNVKALDQHLALLWVVLALTQGSQV